MSRAAAPSAPRVLWVSHGFGYGHDLMYFGEIFRAFRDLCPATEIVVDSRQQKTVPFLNPYGLALRPLLRQLRVPLKRRSSDGQVYQTEFAVPDPLLVARIAASKAEVIITIEFTLPALMAMLAARVLSRKSIVLLIESDPVGRGGGRNKAVLRLKRLAVQTVDVIQTNNEKGRRYLVEQLGADSRKVRVAPYLTSRPPGPPTVIAPHDGPLRMLFANSITARKGLAELFDAIDRLDPETRAGLDFTVVGDGEERTALETRATGFGMGDRLRFVGRRGYAELGQFYATADVLAIPSLADYRSLAGFEGLGYGLALLASRFDGATEETVQDGVNGFVIDPGQPDALANRIRTLVKDRDGMLRMRHASLAFYERRFSVERIAANLSDSVALAVRPGSLDAFGSASGAV